MAEPRRAAAAATSHPVKARMRAGEPALGLSVRITRSPDIARIAKATDHDFLFIDGQHAVFNLETITAIAQVALAVGVAPMVRVRGIDDPDVPALLDNGVTGIIYPDINTAGQARRAVEVCRFPPVGRRSVAGNYVHFDYRARPLPETLRDLDDQCLVAVMIETVEGLRNVEAIAAVPGIDVLHVGTNDLAVDMGKPGRLDDPEIIAALAKVTAVATANGKYAGLGGIRDIARQAEFVRRGIRFFTTQTDVGFLSAAAGAWTSGVRGGGVKA